jgi:hypothetical protein
MSSFFDYGEHPLADHILKLIQSNSIPLDAFVARVIAKMYTKGVFKDFELEGLIQDIIKEDED